MGLAYDINVTTKHVAIRRLNNLPAVAARKDLTSQVQPTIKSDFLKDKQIYAIKQNFDPSDTQVTRPDLTSYKRVADVMNLSELPPPSNLFENNLSLLIPRNWFYACIYNPDTVAYEWQYIANNLYDYEPKDNNQTISTDITPVSQGVLPWRRMFPSGQLAQALLPRIEQAGNWPGKIEKFSNWELRIMFFHGLHRDENNDIYPFASSHHYNMAGEKVANYSLTLTPPEGLVQKFWSNWLSILGSLESVDLVLYLNIKQYIDLTWTDFILIRNVPFLITQMTPQSPFNGRLPCKALRINLTKNSTPQPTCGATVINLEVVDNGNGSATIDWQEGVPGAVAWRYAINGGTSLTVSVHPIVIFGLPEGQHSVVVVPVCGNGASNPAGSASATFNLVLPQPTITLTAVLTTGAEPFNKLQLTAKTFSPWTGLIQFNFGQCVYNSTSNQQACRAFPGALRPDEYATLDFLPGSTSVTKNSNIDTPGDNFGFIVKIVVFGLVGISANKIVKAPGQSWILEVRP